MERGIFWRGFFGSRRLFGKKNKKDPHGTEAAGAKGDCMAGKTRLIYFNVSGFPTASIIPGIFHVEVCDFVIRNGGICLFFRGM